MKNKEKKYLLLRQQNNSLKQLCLEVNLRPRVARSATKWLTAPGLLELSNDVFYLIDSSVFQCMKYHWTTKNTTEEFLFFVSRSVSRTNMVNTNTSNLVLDSKPDSVM
jgi:hypothetical protein